MVKTKIEVQDTQEMGNLIVENNNSEVAPSLTNQAIGLNTKKMIASG